MSFNITVEGGTSVRLPTAGKYCDRDIIVTAEGGGNYSLQEKSVTPSESAQTVKPDTGYDGLSQVSVGAISKTYVGSSVPKQAAQTITPGTADKTIASGRYLTGTQTIKGDANLVAGNIKSGVSIFGVAGTMTAGEDVTAETETYTDLLTDLEAAVDALPDAGSGGSGGAVETCTITLKTFGPPLPNAGDEIIYTDATQTPQKVVHQFGVPYEIVKGSMVTFEGSTFNYTSLNPPTGMEYVNDKTYFVTGDVTFTVS